MAWSCQGNEKRNRVTYRTRNTLPSFISSFACLSSPKESNNSVPVGARAAARQVQQAVRTALVSGKRRLCVDILIAAVDPRSRNFDDDAAATVFDSLIESVQPVLPAEEAQVKVIVSGSTAAVRINSWVKSLQVKNVSVDVLGIYANQDSNDEEDSKQYEKGNPDALIIIDPPGTGDSILDLRKLLRKAHGDNIPVVINNHPRRDALYELLGYGGHIPYEMTSYESVFLLAPFALKAKGDSQPGISSPRFVLMRKFPHKWNLWKYQGLKDKSFLTASESVSDGPISDDEYKLCVEYPYAPSDNDLMKDISTSLGNS